MAATQPQRLPLPTVLRCAFQGYCPNCLLGKLFDSPWRPKRACTICGLPFEYQGATFTMTAFILYLLICGWLIVAGVMLALLFGFFPGYIAVLGASAAGMLLILHRPVRGLWVWCLWRLGYLG